MKVKIRINSVEELEQKGNSRIFVKTLADVAIVEQIIKEIDESEFEGYYPKGLVTVFQDDNNYLIYGGKFDINIKELIKRCREKDIYILVYSCNHHNFDDMLTLERAVERENGVVFVDDFMFKHTNEDRNNQIQFMLPLDFTNIHEDLVSKEVTITSNLEEKEKFKFILPSGDWKIENFVYGNIILKRVKI